jgi:hypothetical protein
MILVLTSGCGRQTATVEEAPFRQAIERYLEANNMALAIKEFKEISDPATGDVRVRASLVHRDLGGPSVTWTFYCQRPANADWSVVRHED